MSSQTPSAEVPVILPAPAVTSPIRASSKWERERDAFRRLLPQLMPSHRGQYVAIHNGAVVASGQKRLDVALQALFQVGNVDIHVGLVSEEPEPISRSGVRRDLSAQGD